MAIIVIREPASIASVDCLVYQFQMDDIGDSNEKKLMGYQLLLSDGTPITEEEKFRPADISELITRDFSDDVRGLVTTMFPIINPLGTVNDNYIIKKVKLSLWEITEDQTTCVVVEGSRVELSLVTVVNGVIQPYERNIFTSPYPGDDMIFLSHQPTVMYQCRDAKNYLWVMGGGQVVYKTPGETDVPVPNTFDAAYMPLFIEDVFPSSYLTAKYFELTFADSPRVYRVYLQDCSCGVNYANIMYLDPKGGRACISFEVVDEYAMNISASEVRRYIECFPEPAESNDNYSVLTAGGRTISNKIASERITLIYTTAYNEENAEWYKAFLASTGYHIQAKDEAGNVVFRKFILESGSYVYRKTEAEIDLVITGYMASDYKNQKIDR